MQYARRTIRRRRSGITIVSLAVFLIVVLILVSDGVTKDDMFVLGEITEFANKKNVTYIYQPFFYAAGLECC
jgi:hypothetical protein